MQKGSQRKSQNTHRFKMEVISTGQGKQVSVVEVAKFFMVDTRTITRNCERVGIKICVVSPHIRRVAYEDFQRLKRRGISYYNDTKNEPR